MFSATGVISVPEAQRPLPVTSGANYFGEWGNVPPDADVQPFSMKNPVREGGDRTNRKHHFVSITYMDGFTDETGRVQVYRSEDPQNPHATQPRATGYQKQYYSQPLPEGGIEHHRFEDLFNTIETVWPETVRALEARRLSQAISFNVQGMQTIMRVRVPAARDRTALMLEAKLRSECKALEEIGALPPEFARYSGQSGTVPIGINPHETLHAMKQQFKEFGDLCFRLGFEVLYNRTGIPFLTSDNPVCIYDPRLSPVDRRPYDYSGEVELLFPVTSRMIVRGSSKRGPANVISRQGDITDRRIVRRMNETIAQFAYRMTIARDRSCDEIIQRHAALVPTIRTEVRQVGKEIQKHVREIFGPRPNLSQYIDTPEKAVRLEEKMAAQAAAGKHEPT